MWDWRTGYSFIHGRNKKPRLGTCLVTLDTYLYDGIGTVRAASARVDTCMDYLLPLECLGRRYDLGLLLRLLSSSLGLY